MTTYCFQWSLQVALVLSHLFVCSPDRKRRLIKPPLKAEIFAAPLSAAPARLTSSRNAAAQMNGKAADSVTLVRTRSTRAVTEMTVSEQPSTSSGGKPLTVKPNPPVSSGKSGRLIHYLCSASKSVKTVYIIPTTLGIYMDLFIMLNCNSVNGKALRKIR